MIAASRSWSGAASADPQLLAKALTAYRGVPQTGTFAGTSLAVAAPLAGLAGGVAFCGWIDNWRELRNATGTTSSDAAALYRAALAKWGDGADGRINGCYCAIVAEADGSLRLSRSPWKAPPLYFASDDNAAAASSLVRVLFAAGVERRPDYDMVIDQLAYDFRDGDTASLYQGIGKVPQGAVVRLRAGSTDTQCWYSPGRLAVEMPQDHDECARRALELVGEASRCALDYVHRIGGKPALALSGGLDSPLVATTLLEAMPSGTSLNTITFAPDPQWDGRCAQGTIGDETQLVREFAAAYPRIAAHFADPAQAGFDHRARQVFSAMQVFAPGLANVGMFHGVYAKAAELQCDVLLSAELANQSFSADGRWAYAEYLRNGRWGELAQLLAARPGDDRPLWRKALALSVLPHLPAKLRHLARSTVHPQRRDMTALLSPLSAKARKEQARRAASRGSGSDWADYTFPRSHAEAIRRDLAASDGDDAEVDVAFYEIYGVQRRDVTAYRPLIEFCLQLETRHFAAHGVERRLARSMARGRLPERQRTATDYGQHNVDWHVRIGRRREELLQEIAIMREHRFLAASLDLDRIEALLLDWPERPGFEIEEDWPRMLAIPRAYLAARFIGTLEGRNDL